MYRSWPATPRSTHLGSGGNGAPSVVKWNPDINQAVGSPYYPEVAFVRNERFHHIAGPNSTTSWRMFAVISSYPFEMDNTRIYDTWEYYHENPPAVHWDGHVSNYSPPPDTEYWALRKHLSRDGTDKDDIFGTP